ncbi:type V toxin-antitoxin system endoribonuclease antitoxin GhoS [Enterobacter sp.]|uniref:type V toxin-antitoxin system endoribonuclease antitoxin GhoS n=1 Tax=Enterobacter sp. TaxID=42895 RepID=UPI0029820C55|nr:type V toxin-antitoxin system endoribonuclease antitoxin GhoS [Enterobacter sp.]
MSRYTVRVELHQNRDDDYEKLHEQMLKAGFTKTITADVSGNTYDLPDAEYNYTSEENKEEVANKAYEIANRIRRKPSILVTKSIGRYFIGLKKTD